MTVDEIRFIARQQRESDWRFPIFDEPWVTDEMLNLALWKIEGVYRSRLASAIGVERKNLELLTMSKLHGGDMKPGISNACYGIRRALYNLSHELKTLRPKKPEQVWTSGHLTCPHCGQEIELHRMEIRLVVI